MHLSMLSRWGGGGGRPGKGGGFDCNHRPVVGFFDRFNDLSSNILLTFGCYFDNPQCSGVGHLNGNSQLSSNVPPMPGLPPPPPQRPNIDRCINFPSTFACSFIAVFSFLVRFFRFFEQVHGHFHGLGLFIPKKLHQGRCLRGG